MDLIYLICWVLKCLMCGSREFKCYSLNGFIIESIKFRNLLN